MFPGSGAYGNGRSNRKVQSDPPWHIDEREFRRGFCMVNASVIFDSFERMVAFRYLRARRAEGFVSVIAIFSLLGIALGVATLIIVMSVMNGFRAELVGRILGANGHLAVYGEGTRLAGFEAAAERVRQVPGVVSVTPLIEGQVMATSDAGASGALVRGTSPVSDS